MMHITRLPRTTFCCPKCGAPMFPLLSDQGTPIEAIQMGITRDEIKICLICAEFWIMEPNDTETRKP